MRVWRRWSVTGAAPAWNSARNSRVSHRTCRASVSYDPLRCRVVWHKDEGAVPTHPQVLREPRLVALQEARELARRRHNAGWRRGPGRRPQRRHRHARLADARKPIHRRAHVIARYCGVLVWRGDVADEFRDIHEQRGARGGRGVQDAEAAGGGDVAEGGVVDKGGGAIHDERGAGGHVGAQVVEGAVCTLASLFDVTLNPTSMHCDRRRAPDGEGWGCAPAT